MHVRQQQLEVQRVRERALRDEGILAIATQAAGAAHELNTPLSTMRTLLPELRREHADDAALAEDLALLRRPGGTLPQRSFARWWPSARRSCRRSPSGSA